MRLLEVQALILQIAVLSPRSMVFSAWNSSAMLLLSCCCFQQCAQCFLVVITAITRGRHSPFESFWSGMRSIRRWRAPTVYQRIS